MMWNHRPKYKPFEKEKILIPKRQTGRNVDF